MKSAELQQQINELDQLIQQGAADAQLNLWEMQRKDLNDQLQVALAEEASQQERVQAQEEQIGGLKETVRSIFEASFPKDETVKIMGLTEYESTQQTFNQLIDQAVDEDQSALYAAFNQQLEQRDEKIRDLNFDVSKQKSIIDWFEENNSGKDDTIANLHEKLVAQEDQANADKTEIQRLRDREFDLQQQIANIQTVPQIIDIIPTAPSESLSERIAKAKVNSKLQLANVRWIGANWVEGINEEGNKEIAHVSEVESVIEFPIIEPVTEVVEPVMEIPFQPEEELRAAAAMVEGSPSGDREVETEESEVEDISAPATQMDLRMLRDAFDKQVDQLSSRVSALESVQRAVA